ncbi:MAG: TM2 domain-containing protein [Oscillospiraceae bacterium]|nr:TM2 domain-containing protein [Oscillospiraceae bacterium]
MADLKAMATSTAPREFELSYSTTLEEVFEKLNARSSAFKMSFELKDGIGGKKISFKKEPELDVALSLTVKDGNKIKITPVIKESQTTVNGMRVDKNSMLRKGVSGVASLPLQRGEYVDAVTDTVKKLLNNEPVADYVAPKATEAQEAQAKDWLTTLLLCIFLGHIGVHRFYVGKTGTGILYILTIGFCGIGYLVDLIKIIMGSFTDKDGNQIKRN